MNKIGIRSKINCSSQGHNVRLTGPTMPRANGAPAARLANVPRCLIGIEAGMATHYVARELGALGHDVKQVPPAYSKPFRQGHKNDFRDAHAIAEAVQRPSTRCVPVKTDDQLDLQLSSAACRFPADVINTAPHAMIAALKRNPFMVTPPSQKKAIIVIRSLSACKLRITTFLTRYLRCFGASYRSFVMTTTGHAMSGLGHSLQVRPRPLVYKCPLCIDTDRKFWALGFAAMCQQPT